MTLQTEFDLTDFVAHGERVFCPQQVIGQLARGFERNCRAHAVALPLLAKAGIEELALYARQALDRLQLDAVWINQLYPRLPLSSWDELQQSPLSRNLSLALLHDGWTRWELGRMRAAPTDIKSRRIQVYRALMIGAFSQLIEQGAIAVLQYPEEVAGLHRHYFPDTLSISRAQ